jgi:MFS family permease
LVAALAVAILVKEPKRGGLDPAVAAAPAPSLWATITMFFSHKPLVLVALACGATQFVTYGVLNFTALFLMREKGMTLHQVAIYYALVIAICMGGGIAISGRVIDHFVPRGKQAYAVIPAVALMCAVPFFCGFVWAPSWPLAILLLGGPTFFNYFYLSSAVAFVQAEVPPNQRVLSGALLLLVMNLIGLGLGPTYVGAASDFFRDSHPGHSLQIAFYTLLPFYGLAIALFLALAALLRRGQNAHA